MFETVRKSEMAAGRLLSDDTAMWPFVTIPLFQEWFVITRSHSCEGQRVVDTVLVQGARSFLEAILALGQDFNVEATHLVSPGWMNGSKDWQMDKLSEVWELDGISGLNRYLYLLEDGSCLPVRKAAEGGERRLVYRSHG